MLCDCVNDPEVLDHEQHGTQVNPALLHSNMAENHVMDRALDPGY